MGNSLIRKIYRETDIDKIYLKKIALGTSGNDAVAYLNIQFFTSLLVFVGLLYLTEKSYIFAPVIAVSYFYLFYYVTLLRPIKLRQKKLEREALYFFEILTLTLESGRNLENSLEIACFNVNSELSNEFKKALFEVKFGKSLIEALTDMKKRIPSEVINNIVLNITQTNVFGNGILETMYNQIEFLRDKQVLEVKGEINKIPNKVSIISVLFILPLILILVLGPFIIGFFS